MVTVVIVCSSGAFVERLWFARLLVVMLWFCRVLEELV
jgi:hypothetical protein